MIDVDGKDVFIVPCNMFGYQLARKLGGYRVGMLCTFKLTRKLHPKIVEELREEGVIGVSALEDFIAHPQTTITVGPLVRPAMNRKLAYVMFSHPKGGVYDFNVKNILAVYVAGTAPKEKYYLVYRTRMPGVYSHITVPGPLGRRVPGFEAVRYSLDENLDLREEKVYVRVRGASGLPVPA